MEGDGAVRFCRLCKKDVHDLSQMTEADARAFLASGEQPCIRIRHDARDEVVFADRPGLLPRLAAAAALALTSLGAGGCLMGKRAPQIGRYPGSTLEAKPVDAPAETRERTGEATPVEPIPPPACVP
jgi:hypothetical protein